MTSKRKYSKRRSMRSRSRSRSRVRKLPKITRRTITRGSRNRGHKNWKPFPVRTTIVYKNDEPFAITMSISKATEKKLNGMSKSEERRLTNKFKSMVSRLLHTTQSKIKFHREFDVIYFSK